MNFVICRVCRWRQVDELDGKGWKPFSSFGSCKWEEPLSIQRPVSGGLDFRSLTSRTFVMWLTSCETHIENQTRGKFNGMKFMLKSPWRFTSKLKVWTSNKFCWTQYNVSVTVESWFRFVRVVLIGRNQFKMFGKWKNNYFSNQRPKWSAFLTEESSAICLLIVVICKSLCRQLTVAVTYWRQLTAIDG